MTVIDVTIACEFDLAAMEALDGDGLRLSFFGAPPCFQLDGGRIIPACKDDFESVVSHLTRRSIPFNLCCNTVLGPDEVEIDRQTWRTIDRLYSPENGIIVSRHWLAERIRERYPEFRFVFSSIGALAEAWDEELLFSAYDVVVCPIERINDFRFLSAAARWRKLEVFLNCGCHRFRPGCIDHYRHISEANNAMRAAEERGCLAEGLSATNPGIEPSVIDVSRYLRLGVRRFKCLERTYTRQDFTGYLDRVRSASAMSGGVAALQQSLADASDPGQRLKILVRLVQLGADDELRAMKAELSKVEEASDPGHAAVVDAALRTLRAADAEWAEAWAAERSLPGR